VFVDKPAGLVVQRAYDPDEPVLVEMMARYTAPFFLMQRLDRGTSGVMFFSKSAGVNAKLTRQFERKAIRKTYIALCEGELGEKQTIDAPLVRIGAIKFAVAPLEGRLQAAGTPEDRLQPAGTDARPAEAGPPRQVAKRAVTHVTPLEPTRSGSLLSIILETGRTHQIRVHLAAIGHPLVGDWLYGERNATRPMLHAAELEMTHPVTNQPLRVSAPLPSDLIEEAARRGIVTA
jgi:23S rRNA-/tRNA-specific pseudouridylate synthase